MSRVRKRRENVGCDTGWDASRAAPHGEQAFTLIEIMIVVGIIALVVAMGMPAFIQTSKKEPLRKAVSDIVDACNEARAQAILKGVPAALTIRAADGQIAVTTLKTNRAGPGGPEPSLTESATSEGAVAPPVYFAHLHEDIAVSLLYVNLKDRMEAEESSVHFYPNGTSDEFTIVLQSGVGIRKISLECVTGLPTVESIR